MGVDVQAGKIVWGVDAAGNLVRLLVAPDGKVIIDGTISISGTVDVSDRAARLLGIVYGSQSAQLLQRAATNDLIVQLRSAGAEIDPRAIRALTAADVVTAVQAVAANLNATVTQAAKDRTISDVTKVPTSKYLTPTALGIGGTATIWDPAAGKKIRLKRIQISVDAATRVDLRWAATAFESYYLPANGSVVVNFIATNHEGAADENLTLLSSAAATVTASASGDEI